MRICWLVGLLVACAGCSTPGRKAEERPESRQEVVSVRIDEAAGDRIDVTLFHEVSEKEEPESLAEGKKTRFSIPVDPGVWVRVKRCDEDLDYDVVCECLIDGEMVPVSGMPGDNFSVKVEELALDKYRVMGVFLCCRQTVTGNVGKTVSFDFVANPGDETTVFREMYVAIDE